MAGLPHEREHFGRDSLYVQQTLVKAFYLAGRVRDREALPDALTADCPHGRGAGGVGEQGPHGFGHRGRVAHGHEEAGDVRQHDLA